MYYIVYTASVFLVLLTELVNVAIFALKQFEMNRKMTGIIQAPKSKTKLISSGTNEKEIKKFVFYGLNKTYCVELSTFHYPHLN